MEQTNEKKKYIIYMYTFPNGKRYIGKTSKTLKERQVDELWSGYKKCPLVFSAIEKYKPANIKQDILTEGIMTDEESGKIERYYIALYKTNCNRYRNPEYGYNLTDGGDGACGPRPDYRGEKHHSSKAVYCVEFDTYYENAIFAEATTGIDAREIRSCCRGDHIVCKVNGSIKNGVHWLWAKDVCDEKIQEVLSLDSRSHLYTPVYCIELNRYFKSIQDAEDELDIVGITQVLRGQARAAGRHPQTGGLLHWLHADNVSKDSIWNALNPPAIIYYGTEVYCIELNLAFVSISVPCKALGISRKTLRQCVNKEIETAGLSPYDKSPLHWILLSECKDMDGISILSEFKIDKFKQRIYCVELDMYFDGSRDAASFVHTSRNTLRDCLCGNRETAGFHPETGEPLHWKHAYNESFNNNKDG